jgi:hypothetical protein
VDAPRVLLKSREDAPWMHLGVIGHLVSFETKTTDLSVVWCYAAVSECAWRAQVKHKEV